MDAQISTQWGDNWTLWASHAYQEAKITRDDRDAALSLQGREVAATPRYISNIGVDYQASEQLKLSGWMNAQGDYYLERTNTQGRAGKFAVLNLGASYRLSDTMDLGLQVKNVTNRKYVYAWYDSGSSGYSPADGRAARSR